MQLSDDKKKAPTCWSRKSHPDPLRFKRLKKMKNGFAMMSGFDKPLGACLSIIIDERAPRC